MVRQRVKSLVQSLEGNTLQKVLAFPTLRPSRIETSVGSDEIAVWGTAAEARSAENRNKPSFTSYF